MIGRSNVPNASILASIDLPEVSGAFLDYDDDSGNVTTLNHVLFVNNMYVNATVGDVLDVEGEPICSEYIYDAVW